MYKTTKALVLREVKYKDADKLLTVLTDGDGKMTVKARGALRKSCKYAAASQVLTFSEMTLFGNRGRWSITEAETIEQFTALRGRIEDLALASYFAEALESLSDEDSPEPALLQLGLNSLYALSKGLYPPEHIKAAFELRLMCLAGFEPELSGCSVCGSTQTQDMLFSVGGGVLHCRSCVPDAYGLSLPVSGGTIHAMRYIIGTEPKKLFSFALPPRDAGELETLTEAYMQAQLERKFGALEYWKTVNFKG